MGTLSADESSFPGFDGWRWGISAMNRIDDLGWTISDVDGNPNILSELIWHGIRSAGIEGRLGTKVGRLLIEADLVLGGIYRGENRDSDYLENDRIAEFSRSVNRSDDGMVWEGKVGAGFVLPFEASIVTLRLLGGLVARGQHMTMTDGYQVVTSALAPPLGPITGLDSFYRSGWFGPWAGVLTALEPWEGLRLHFGLEYGLAYYYAWADWNLRDDFAHPKSFDHTALGYGFSLRGGFAVGRGVRLAGDVVYRRWATARGVDRTFLDSGFYVRTPLNGVWWSSFRFQASLLFQSSPR